MTRDFLILFDNYSEALNGFNKLNSLLVNGKTKMFNELDLKEIRDDMLNGYLSDKIKQGLDSDL